MKNLITKIIAIMYIYALAATVTFMLTDSLTWVELLLIWSAPFITAIIYSILERIYERITSRPDRTLLEEVGD